MREIKFRAWDTKEKVMLSAESQKFIIIPSKPFGAGKHFEYDNYKDIHDSEISCFDWASADLICGRYELMQFTGLQDKNGDDIYEGDILQGSETSPKYSVVMEKGRWGAVYRYKGNGGFIDLFDKNHLFEIIGNIHQNPELLEAKDA